MVVNEPGQVYGTFDVVSEGIKREVETPPSDRVSYSVVVYDPVHVEVTGSVVIVGTKTEGETTPSDPV